MTVNRLTCNSVSVVLGYAYDATVQSMQSIKYSKCIASYDLIPSHESQTNCYILKFKTWFKMINQSFGLNKKFN